MATGGRARNAVAYRNKALARRNKPRPRNRRIVHSVVRERTQEVFVLMYRSLGLLVRGSLGGLAVLFATLSLTACPQEGATPIASPEASIDPPLDAGAATGDAGKPARPATHSGLVSVQDIAIANLPAAGHGLTVTAILSAAVAPDYEEVPGAIEGCRVFTYDVDAKPQPPEEDHGALRVEGARGGNLECRFVPQRGYACPTAAYSGNASIEASDAGVMLSLPGAAFSANDVGRYVQVTGSGVPANTGAFAILAAPSPTSVAIANPRAVPESFAGSFSVLAGAGPTPADLYRPFEGVSGVGLDLAETAVFAAPKATLRPGDPFVLDDASAKTLVAVPLDGSAITLRCATCGTADGTIVRIQTTDASVAGLSPVAFPAPKKKSVEIQCVRLGTGEVTVPAAAMDYVRRSHLASPIARIRTAYMRDGLAVHTAPAPMPANRIARAVGRGMLGFTSPEAR